MKQCTKCKITKNLSEFSKDKSRSDGYFPHCKACMAAYKRSKEGVISTIYSGQRSRSKLRGHRPPEYTKQELQDWLFSQTLFHELYDEWVQSGYKKRLKPSVDRKYDDVHYCMRNIQLMTWGENRDKSAKDISRGILRVAPSVLQYDLEGNFIAEYRMQKIAAAATGVDQSKISEVCSGKRRTAGGFVWRYKDA